MAMKRRGFLGGMLASLAAPAVKEAEVFNKGHIGADALSTGYGGDGLLFAGEVKGSASSRRKPWWISKRLKLEAMKLIDPGFILEKARRDAREVHRIDPSIMALRSVSAAGKIAMQREKNFRELSDIDREIDDLRWYEREASFKVDE